ncbi:jupiter microtubule associated homolog 1a [Chanos chanos]|uniref:Jupiter microtubule associated homolog 1a n=1 Tax=Chanos chanos TaxID=29144 RepID=A0A6J2W324_CHACN|nr:jupiter microtubule associated homolog 1-like [Chanos chanos]
MTTTTTFQGLDPGSKSSSRVLRPPGGGSNISFGNEEEKPVNRKDKMASSIFAEPEDPHAHRRNNPPGGAPSGVLCGEPSAPLRRCHTQAAAQNNTTPEESTTGDGETLNAENTEEPESVPEQKEETQAHATAQAAGLSSGRRNPPGGKSSLILG